MDATNVSRPGVSLGSMVGPYRIASDLGDDGAATSYEAEDTRSHQRVTLTLLPRTLTAADFLRLTQAVRVARGLDHPHLAAVLESGRFDDGTPYLAAEFVGGESAADQLSRLGRLPWRDATRLVIAACRGVSAAHAAGLTHGAIRPACLRIGHDGGVKVAGWCLPPAGSTDVRSDLPALAATYVTLLTGRAPPVPNVREGLPSIPLRCDTILRKALAPDPAEGYPSAAALQADLEAMLAADSAPAPPLPRIPSLKPRRPPLWKRLAKWAGGTAALAVVAVVAALGYLAITPRPNAGKEADDAMRPRFALPTLTNSIGMVLARVSAGRTMIGDPLIANARPQHFVQFSRPLCVGVHEVTLGQYRLVTGENPSELRDERMPVAGVSWEEAKAFCEKLSDRQPERDAGRKYRLPTEAEWEACCRAGTAMPFAFGPTLSPRQANYDTAGLGRPVPVGAYSPNPWGLYDMHGNVAEWCADWYGAEAYATAVLVDPPGPSTGTKRVVRGGGYATPAEDCRSGSRLDTYPPQTRDPMVGFRVVFSE